VRISEVCRSRQSKSRLFDYFVRERKLHNLIWVYNAAHVAHGGKGRDGSFDSEIAYRKRFYPGAAYVDFASIDTYANPKLGWGAPQEDARRRAYELMREVAPGKMLAVGEDAALLNPDVAQKDGPKWVYNLSWWAGGRSNPVGWMRKTFNHEQMLTLDEIPVLVAGNVLPNVRIDAPADGAELRTINVQLSGFAVDRNANLEEVSVHALRGPWRNWFLRGDAAVLEAFAEETSLGQARLSPDGRWSFTWKNAPAGICNLVAVSRDADGAVACSNAVRVTVGLENLARGKAATASSTSKHGESAAAAVDGDPNTMWWSDREAADPQWLMVDLGAPRTVGGVAVAWWKAYPKAYTVETSTDGQGWRKAGAVACRRNYHGDMDVVRFEPVEARYVRLHCTEPAVDWQAYTVFELGVYAAIPE